MGAGPFFYGKKSPTPERILSYAEGCPASAGLWIKKKQSGPHGPSPPCEGRGTVRKHGGGGIGGSRYFAGAMDNSWTCGRNVEGENRRPRSPRFCISDRLETGCPPRYSVLSGPHAPTTGQARSPAPAGRTGSPALLVLCASIHRFSRSWEGRPRRSRRDNIGCRRSWGGAGGDSVRLPGP